LVLCLLLVSFPLTSSPLLGIVSPGIPHTPPTTAIIDIIAILDETQSFVLWHYDVVVP
jgi:hypothetical protein